MAGPRCLYCGAPLPPGALPPAAIDSPVPARADEGKALVILDVEGADAKRLATVLDLAPFEAAQRIRRGGLDLWRSMPAAGAVAEVARLGAAGVRAAAIPEGAVRQGSRPSAATGGRIEGGSLLARCAGGTLRIEEAGVLLIVQGDITREYEAVPQVRRSRTATLDPGCRIHVHLRESSAPVEIDPGNFDFGKVLVGRSSLLTLLDWLTSVAPNAPVDRGFRRQTPALAPAEADLAGPAAAARVLSRSVSPSRKGGVASILDNLAQFRFYSAWRGAAERLRPFGGPS
jgi:hypothetical protein